MNPTLSGILAIFMWGCLAVLIALTGNVPGFQLASMTFFIGFLSLFVFQIVRGENVFVYWKQPLKNYILVLSGVGLYTTLLYLSFKKIPAFEANTINYLWPVFLSLLLTFSCGDRVTVVKVCGMVCGFAGMVALFYPDNEQDIFSNIGSGHIMALMAAIIWALYSVIARSFSYPSGFMAPIFLLSSFLCLFFHLQMEQTIAPSMIEWVTITLLGVFRMSYVMWDIGMKRGNAAFLASISYLIPLISVIFLSLSGFGPSRPMAGVGAILVIAGCLFINLPGILKLKKSLFGK